MHILEVLRVEKIAHFNTLPNANVNLKACENDKDVLTSLTHSKKGKHEIRICAMHNHPYLCSSRMTQLYII